MGIEDAMAMILWIQLFLEAQGYVVQDNIIFQDNQSAMLLKNNGCQSSGKNTLIDIQYYFITENTSDLLSH